MGSKVHRETSTKYASASKAVIVDLVNPGLKYQLDWPKISEIVKQQLEATEMPPGRFLRKYKGIVEKCDVYWVPYAEHELKLGILG